MVTHKVDGNTLTLTVELETQKDARESSTGKNKIRASSRGFVSLNDKDGTRYNFTAICDK